MKPQPIDAPRENRSEWLSYRTTQKKLRVRKKQIAALVAAGVLKTRFEVLPGGKAAGRYSSADVERVALDYRRDKPVIPLTMKLWMTPEEASQYSGLPKAYIMRQVKEGKITGRKWGTQGSWRIPRKSLEAFEG
jgi:excisionase family DNA binding protein